MSEEKKEEEWFCIAVISDKGFDAFFCTQDSDAISVLFQPLHLKARVHSHWNAALYVWTQEYETKLKDVEKNEKYIRLIKKRANKMS